MDKLLLRPAEAAELLGVSRSRLYALLAEGRLPVVRIGQTMRVPVRELERWIGEQTCSPADGVATVGGCNEPAAD